MRVEKDAGFFSRWFVARSDRPLLPFYTPPSRLPSSAAPPAAPPRPTSMAKSSSKGFISYFAVDEARSPPFGREIEARGIEVPR